jgi:hypothetical protein
MTIRIAIPAPIRGCAALAAGLLLIPGCQDARVRSYDVPREAAPAAMPAAVPEPAPPAAPQAGIPSTPRWRLPAGWTELPGSGMRFATLVVEPGNPPLEVRVTPLSQAARDLVDNVNRWRLQIGLPAVMATEVGESVTEIRAGDATIEMVDLTGPATAEEPSRRILAGILPGGESVWFFLMLDRADRVAPHVGAFADFLKSVRLEAAPAAMAGGGSAPPAAGAAGAGSAGGAGGAGGMAWTLPAGWTLDPTPRDMRVATITVGGGAAELAITRFGGPGGDLLANINRWRNQLGLPPVAAAADQPAEPVTVAGHAAGLIDISEAGEAPARRRTMVVGFNEGDANWFIKLTGPHDRLTAEAAAFRSFLGSVRMTGGGS